MKTAIIYCRVSTNKQSQEGESLDLQEKMCYHVAKMKEYKVLKVWRESFSGSLAKRPQLDDMFLYIKNSKIKIDALIFRDIDRISRGGSFGYKEIKNKLSNYNISLIDSYGLIQKEINTLENLGMEYSWSKYSPSELGETVKAEMSYDERRSILTRMIGAEIKNIQDGYWVGMPNDGYINKKIFIKGKKKTIQVIDKNRAKYFIKMFKLRAEGMYSDQEISDILNKDGFKTRIFKKWDKNHEKIIGQKGGKKLSPKILQRIIQRMIYCGIICRKWTKYQPVKAKFGGLISVETFNKANRGKIVIKELKNEEMEILYNNELQRNFIPKNSNNPLYPFKRVVMCPFCNKPFYGSAPKGKLGKKHPTYHCSRGHKYFGINKKKFEDTLLNYLEKLQFTELFYINFSEALKEVWKEENNKSGKIEEKTQEKISSLQKEVTQTALSFAKTENETIKKTLEKKVEDLEKEIKIISNSELLEVIKEEEIEGFLKLAKNFLEHPKKLFDNSLGINKIQALLKLVFRKSPNYFEIESGTPKLSLIFQLFERFKKDDEQLVIWVGFEPTTVCLKGSCSTN